MCVCVWGGGVDVYVIVKLTCETPLHHTHYPTTTEYIVFALHDTISIFIT